MSVRLFPITLLAFAAAGCQFDDPCGKNDLVYRRGLCFPPEPDAAPPPPASDAGADGGDGAAGPLACDVVCDLFGSCLADNPMAAGFLMDQLPMLGFAGSDRTGCVSHCEMNTGGAEDPAVIACLAATDEGMCDQSNLGGALPAVRAVDACCTNKTGSNYCIEVCTVLKTNPDAYNLVAACKVLVP